MALQPHVVAQFVVGPQCPGDSDLDGIRRAVVATLSGALGTEATFVMCGPKPSVGTNVVTVGSWVDREEFTDDQLRAELAENDLLASGRTAALLVTADLVKLLTYAQFPDLPQRRGSVTIREVDVSFDPGVMTTRVRGNAKRRFLPSVGFTYTVKERLSVNTPGTIPPIGAQSSTDVDAGLPSVLAYALLIGLLSPLLGAVTIFAADPLIEALAPDVKGPGGMVAATWPSEVLTRIRPPLLPGKFLLNWSEVTVDEQGVLSLDPPFWWSGLSGRGTEMTS